LDDKELALIIADVALEKQAQDLEIIDVSKFVDYAGYVIVCGGRSERQVRAIVDAVQQALKARGVKLLGVEGLGDGHWVLIDAGGVIVHVFHESARSYYDIEGMWLDAPRLSGRDAECPPGEEEQRGRCASGS
jgi:ribosome-associated protein